MRQLLSGDLLEKEQAGFEPGATKFTSQALPLSHHSTVIFFWTQPWTLFVFFFVQHTVYFILAFTMIEYCLVELLWTPLEVCLLSCLPLSFISCSIVTRRSTTLDNLRSKGCGKKGRLRKKSCCQKIYDRPRFEPRTSRSPSKHVLH